MKTLHLHEWSTKVGLELTATQRDVLRTRLRARVQPTVGAVDRYDVTPGNVVGAILADGLMLLVQPKLPISRILFLLGYAADPGHWSEGDAQIADASDVVAGVAALFTALCDRALGRGVLTGYRDAEDDLATVRGRIDLAEQLRRRPGLDLPLAVRYVEYDEDVLENRLLLAAARQVVRLPIRNLAVQRAMHRILATFASVTTISFPASAVPRVTWTRLNQHYRAAVELARLLLQLRTPEVDGGDVASQELTIDMAALFECFVRVALREELHVAPVQFPNGDDCPPLHLDAAGRIRVRPDLSYWVSGRCDFVGDVKYKRDDGPGQHSDLYQLLAYATATQVPRAMLVYADGPPSPSVHLVPAPHIELEAHHLNLSEPPARILEQLSHIAQHISLAGRVSGV